VKLPFHHPSKLAPRYTLRETRIVLDQMRVYKETANRPLLEDYRVKPVPPELDCCRNTCGPAPHDRDIGTILVSPLIHSSTPVSQSTGNPKPLEVQIQAPTASILHMCQTRFNA
jgi:hypothetical protein